MSEWIWIRLLCVLVVGRIMHSGWLFLRFSLRCFLVGRSRDHEAPFGVRGLPGVSQRGYGVVAQEGLRVCGLLVLTMIGSVRRTSRQRKPTLSKPQIAYLAPIRSNRRHIHDVPFIDQLL